MYLLTIYLLYVPQHSRLNDTLDGKEHQTGTAVPPMDNPVQSWIATLIPARLVPIGIFMCTTSFGASVRYGYDMTDPGGVRHRMIKRTWTETH